MKVKATIKWLSLILGPIGAAVAMFLDYKKRHSDSLQVTQVKVTPVKNTDIESKTSSAATQKLNERERY